MIELYPYFTFVMIPTDTYKLEMKDRITKSVLVQLYICFHTECEIYKSEESYIVNFR